MFEFNLILIRVYLPAPANTGSDYRLQTSFDYAGFMRGYDIGNSPRCELKSIPTSFIHPFRISVTIDRISDSAVIQTVIAYRRK